MKGEPSMNCDKIRELMFDYALGELDGKAMLEVRNHIDECEECKKEYEMTLGMLRAIKESEFDAPKELHSAIMSSVSAEMKRVKRARLIRNLTAIGGCAAAFIIAINIWLDMLPKNNEEKPNNEAPSITVKADDVFDAHLTDENVYDGETVLLSANTVQSFVGEWTLTDEYGRDVRMIISEDCSVVVSVTDKYGQEIYFDGMLEFTNKGIALSQSDGNVYFRAMIEAVRDGNKLHFDVISGKTPWREATS